MNRNKQNVTFAVNKVMGEMFYLSPDFDSQGHQNIEGPAPEEGQIVHLNWTEDYLLQMIFEWDLLRLMTANLTALPPDELPQDWVRQTACEASAVVWGQYHALYEAADQSAIGLIYPHPAEKRLDITGARWHFNFCAESFRLNVSLVNESLL